MSVSKIIAGSQPKVLHLILWFLLVFYFQFVVILAGCMPYLCIFVEEVVTLLGVITDKWM